MNQVTSIMGHSKDEKSHFKTKIRHILERLIRKFGMGTIEPLVPESDRKLIVNIRKRKERLKKKKNANNSTTNNGQGESDSEGPAVVNLFCGKINSHKDESFQTLGLEFQKL